MVYLLVVLLIVFLAYKFDLGKRRFSNKPYAVLYLVLVLLSGLSYRLGFDSIGYEYSFNNTYSDSFDADELIEGFVGFGSQREPLWFILNWAFYNVFGEFWVFKIFYALFVNGVVFWFIKKHCSTPYLAILLYFIFAFFEYNFETLRQALGISFFLIALDGYMSTEGIKKYLKYYLWIIPAFFCHHFAILTILFPLFSRIKLNATFIFWSFIVVIFLANLANIFLHITGLDIISDAMAENIEDKMNSDTYGLGQGLNIIGIIVKLTFGVLPGLFLLKQHKSGALVAFSVLYYILMFSNNYFHFLFRIAEFFIIPVCISLSESYLIGIRSIDAKKIGKTANKYLVFICFVFILFSKTISLITSEQWVAYYPYSSVIKKEVDRDREKAFSEHRTNDYFLY